MEQQFPARNSLIKNDLEFKGLSYIEKAQTGFLIDLVKYAQARSPYYAKVLAKAGITGASIKKLSDLKKLPITTKTHLQKDNLDFFCVDRDEMAEVVSTTGTTGDPVFIALTKKDLERLSLNEVRSFRCAGAENSDIFHIAVTLDNLFMAGMAYYSGITRIGACVYRAGMSNVKKQVDLIQRLRPSGIITVPSFLYRIIEVLKAEGIKKNDLTIKKVLLVGESIRDEKFKLNQLGKAISVDFPVELYSTYGNSECGISFCECSAKKGGHEHSDLIISEILDDEGNVLPDGSLGELVMTTLQVEGMPLIRYRTGDITFKIAGKCTCGRNSVRLGPILGRKAQMMKFKGVKVYPMTIDNAVLSVKGVRNHIIEVFTGDDHSDKIVVKVGCGKKNQKLKKEIKQIIQAHARVTPQIELLSVEEVEDLRTEKGTRRKMRTFIDNRKKTIVDGA